MGMFGVIIYLPLFMQGVLGVSATQSGNLLTPLLMGAVVGSIVGGQTVSRTGEYKMRRRSSDRSWSPPAWFCSRAWTATTRAALRRRAAMVVAGLGMGLLQPVYTLAVQNVAPRERMGAATSSTIFFRSIGSTVGVAAFGSVMLTRYHNEFAQPMPAEVPAIGAAVLLESAAAGADPAAARSRRSAESPAGSRCCQTLFAGVKPALAHGLQQIFFWSAVIMDAGGRAAPAAAERTAAHALGEPELAAP